MASTLAQLLQLAPDQAIVRMLNDVNGTDFRLDGFVVGAPTTVSYTTTKVTLTPKAIPLTLDDQMPTGSLDFVYERLDLALFLVNVLTDWHPSLPCSTQNVLDEITHRMDQDFYGDDIVLEEVTRDNGVQYQLKAKAESLRFIGSIALPLIQLTDISTVFNSGLIAGITNVTQVKLPIDASVGFINATDLMPQIDSIAVNSTIGSSADFLLTVINEAVPDPNTGALDPSTWYASVTPGPYNLYGAKVSSRTRNIDKTQVIDAAGNIVPPINPAIPDLDTALIIQPSATYCTNFSGPLTIPYSTRDFSLDGFNTQPRLIFNSVVSLSNGTAWNAYLNGLAIGTDLSTFQSSPPVTMDGAAAWSSVPGLFTKTNLYGASVVYNGQLRSSDLPPATVSMDRVMVVELGPYNSVYQGTYPFYYTAPIVMHETNLRSTLGSAVHVDFTPLAGTGPFTYAVDSATLPPGLTLSGSLLTGTPTTEGSYTYTLSITDASGNVVTFVVSHLVTAQIAVLELSGTLPNATAGDTGWYGFLDISGGQAPYTLGTITGDLPATVIAEIIFNTVYLHGTWEDNAVHHFDIQVTSTDGQLASKSFAFQATGSLLSVTADSSWINPIYTKMAFSGSFTVLGGTAPYAYSISAGALPAGLVLNPSTGQVTGTPTAAGAFSFTLHVEGADGSQGNVTVTGMVDVLTLQSIVSVDGAVGSWPMDEASGTVMTDTSGNGNNGTYNTNAGVTHDGPPLRSGAVRSVNISALTYAARIPATGPLFFANEDPFSIEIIIQKNGAGGSGMNSLVTAWTNYLNGYGFGMGLRGTGFNYPFGFATTDSNDGIHSSVAVLAGAPNHIVYSRGSDGYFRVYLNGQKVAQSANPSASGTNCGSFWDVLGAASYPNSYGFIGYASDLAIYNYALSDAQVLAHAQAAGLA